MKQITVRGIPKNLERKIRGEALKKKVSINKAVISLISGAAGKKAGNKKTKSVYKDLRHLAGTWTLEEANAFDDYLGTARKIDEGLWKKIE